MNFVQDPNISMTTLQGYVAATIHQLEAVFGHPTYDETSADDKVDVEWNLRFDDGTVATIYNWKDYDGGAHVRSGVEYTWHIGGKNQIAVANVLETLGV